MEDKIKFEIGRSTALRSRILAHVNLWNLDSGGSTVNPVEPLLRWGSWLRYVQVLTADLFWRCSLAAADVFRRSWAGLDPELHWTEAINAITEWRERWRAPRGDSGRDYTRIAVSVAIDFAFMPHHSRPHPQVAVPPHLFVLKVFDWLTALFGPTIANHPYLREWAEHRWINFTHFGELGGVVTRKKPVPRSHLAETWSRYSALMGDRKQADWHLLIVSLESKEKPKLEDVLDTTKFCPIVIQVGDANGDLSGEANYLAKSTYFRDEKPTGTLSIYIDLAANSPHRTFSKRKRNGRIDVAINIGCTAAVPLWVFRKPDWKNGDAGFKGYKAAENLLARWTKRFRGDMDRQTRDLIMGNVHLLSTGQERAGRHGQSSTTILLCAMC